MVGFFQQAGLLSCLIFCLAYELQGQYDPAAGEAGSLAISAQDARIVAWAERASVERGWQHWENRALGRASSGTTASVLGPANGQTLSLGDGGSVVLEFSAPLYNGSGPDFVVFENAFNDFFLELAFVEVSSDGLNYHRFEAAYAGDTLNQIGGFGQTRAEYYHNLAGKYRSGFGVGFDLEELRHRPNLDIDNITHIRIIDVVGCLICFDADNRDAQARPINDPYPTPFPTAGFDLDAVGAIHLRGLSSVEAGFRPSLALGPRFWPNPVLVSGSLQSSDWLATQVPLHDVSGRLLAYVVFDAWGRASLPDGIAKGFYYLGSWPLRVD